MTINETIAELRSEIERLKIRLLSAAGDDLCRLTQEEIKAYSSGAVKIPPKEEFIASCERFHSQIASEAGVLTNCLTLAQLIAENQTQAARIASLESELAAAKAEIADLKVSEALGDELNGRLIAEGADATLFTIFQRQAAPALRATLDEQGRRFNAMMLEVAEKDASDAARCESERNPDA